MGTYFAPFVGPAGLRVPTFNQIQQFLIDNYLTIYGASVYIGADSSDGQDIGIRSLQASDVNQGLQYVYLSLNPQTAIGAALDLIGKVIGTPRKQASNSTGLLTLTGTAGTVVLNGLVQDVNGNFWNLPTSVTIGSGGTVNALATAAQLGNILANPGTIITISSPTAGWISVTNGAAATPGEAVEPDSAYRARLQISQALPSLSLLAGTQAGIAAVPDVTRVVVYENPYGYTASFGLCDTSGTAVTVTNGYPLDSSIVGQPIVIDGVQYSISAFGSSTTLTLGGSAGSQTGVPFYIGSAVALGPAHSITAVVEGGSQTAIAQTIYNNKNPGVLTNGTTIVNVTDPSNGNITMPISFDILTYVEIYVTMNVQPLTGYTSATTAAIQQAILNYLDSLGIGQSVIWSQLFNAATSVQPNQDEPLFSIRLLESGAAAAQTTANTLITNPDIYVASAVGIATSQVAVGAGIPNNTTVSSVTPGQAVTETVLAAGTGYTTATGLSVTGGSGTALTVDITASGGNISAAVSNALGSGYVVGDVVTVIQGGASAGTLTITAIQNEVVLSNNATATATGVPVTFFPVGDADLAIGYAQAPNSANAFVVVNVN